MLAVLLFVLGEAQARWLAAPPRVEIGQPFELTLEIRAPAGSDVLLPDKDPALDSSWVLLEPRRVQRRVQGGELVLDLSWKICSLEPGARVPWEIELPVETPTGRVSVKPAGAPLEVRAALCEGEDAPRPPRGFLPLSEEPRSRGWIPWAAAGVLLAGALGVWIVRRRRRPAPLAPAGPLERLAHLEREFGAQEPRARETVFALTRIVRERIDARLNQPRAALPDEEWAQLVAPDPRLPLAAREAAQRLLAKADPVKYAQTTPSRFLVEELCAEARAVLQALETPEGLAA